MTQTDQARAELALNNPDFRLVNRLLAEYADALETRIADLERALRTTNQAPADFAGDSLQESPPQTPVSPATPTEPPAPAAGPTTFVNVATT